MVLGSDVVLTYKSSDTQAQAQAQASGKTARNLGATDIFSDSPKCLMSFLCVYFFESGLK